MITPDQAVAFHRDGYVVVRGLLGPDEVAPLAAACVADPTFGGRMRAVADSAGNAQNIIGFQAQPSTLLGSLPNLTRFVRGAERLLGGPCYHWHSKISAKPPHTAGRWDWHQDFPYWYDDGCLWPDMLTVTVAVDRSTVENGCMRLVKGSHRLGRVDHPAVNGTPMFDPVRLELVLQQLDVVPMLLEPGDACFFHGNTLHASGPNESNEPRTLAHMSYNLIANSPFVTEGQEHHRYRPFELVADDALRGHARSAIYDDGTFPVRRPGARNGYGYRTLSSN